MEYTHAGTADNGQCGVLPLDTVAVVELFESGAVSQRVGVVYDDGQDQCAAGTADVV